MRVAAICIFMVVVQVAMGAASLEELKELAMAGAKEAQVPNIANKGSGGERGD